jgi:hypothetical protein
MSNIPVKKIADYLHLYLGCDCLYSDNHFLKGERFVLTSGNLFWAISATQDFKPILRPLSDMTEEDFYSFFPQETQTDILIKGKVDRLWCAGFYDKKEYQERVDEDLPVDSESLLYDLEEADHDNVFSTTKAGDLAYGTSDEMRYFTDVPTLAAWHTHLRKREINIDGLIKAGLAIDKSKLPKP